MINGYIEDVVKDTDWRVGGETGVVYTERTDGDWTKYLPVNERQSNAVVESSFCTTFSGLNCIETQLNYLLFTNQIQPEALAFFTDNGYIENGVFNLNDSFNATLNGTSRQGQSLVNFWESIRKVGAIPQNRWTQVEDAITWEDLTKEIPQELLDLGKKFLQYVDIKYEWVVLGKIDSFLISQALKQSPLHIATPVCGTWSLDEIIVSCGLTNPQHATLLIKSSPEYYTDFDTYRPFVKRLATDYYIVYAMKGLITTKVPSVKRYSPLQSVLVRGDTGTEVSTLQNMLKDEGLFTLIPNGIYGPATAKAVFAFQLKYEVKTLAAVLWYKGNRVGPNTLAMLNSRWG